MPSVVSAAVEKIVAFLQRHPDPRIRIVIAEPTASFALAEFKKASFAYPTLPLQLSAFALVRYAC